MEEYAAYSPAFSCSSGIRSARVTPLKKSWMRPFSFCHRGRVGQLSWRGQGSALDSRQATGANSPSVKRRMLPMVYSSGALVSR